MKNKVIAFMLTLVMAIGLIVPTSVAFADSFYNEAPEEEELIIDQQEEETEDQEEVQKEPELTPEEEDEAAVMGSAGEEDESAPEISDVTTGAAAETYVTTSMSGHTFYHRTTDVAGCAIIKVIDISKWQGALSKSNFQRVKNSGVQGVIIRCAYQNGNGAVYKDERFENNYAQAKAAGLKVGVYIYTEAVTTGEATSQATYVRNLLKGKSLELPVVFDYEDCLKRVSRYGISKAAGANISMAFLKTVKSYGYEPMLYTGMAFNNAHNNAYTVKSNGYPIWLARYNSWPYKAANDAKRGYYSGKIDAWQSSGGSGMSCYVDGISGAVDFDWWYDPITVKLNRTSASIATGKTVSISPSSATKHFGGYSESYSYSSSNTGVATVSGGTVRGVKAGTATITVRGSKSGKTATCKVTVTGPADAVKPTLSNVKVSNVTPTSYTVTCTATDNIGIQDVKFPSWETSKGSGGCTWYAGKKGSNNTWSFTYSGLRPGTSYTTHVYAYDTSGNYSAVNAGNTVTTKDTTKPSLSGAKISGITTNGFTTSCTATDNAAVTKVNFKIYETAKGASSGTNYAGKKSGNTWSYAFASAKSGVKYSVQITAYDASGNNATISGGTATTLNAVPVYRLYNPLTGEHVWTINKSEWSSLPKKGYKQEGIAWYAPTTGSAVYKLYNRATSNHLYTCNAAEAKQLIKAGWRYENSGKPVFYSGGSRAVYRLYKAKQKKENHHLTTESSEINALKKSGWKLEGVAMYGK